MPRSGYIKRSGCEIATPATEVAVWIVATRGCHGRPAPASVSPIREPSGLAERRSCHFSSTPEGPVVLGWRRTCFRFGVSNPIGAKKLRCRRRFLRFFPDGFSDERYLAWERDYKAEAHARWKAKLSGRRFAEFLAAGQYNEVTVEALRIEARTNLLFSFEKMALRDAVRTASGARRFAEGLYAWLHGRGSMQARFGAWCEAIAELPRRQTRVLTWPLVTVFGFLAQPDRHIFLKPNVTRLAAVRYGFDFHYRSQPNWTTYAELLDLAALVRLDQRDLGPRDFIDAQSFLWVQGSEEYQGRSFRPLQTTRVTALKERAS